MLEKVVTVLAAAAAGAGWLGAGPGVAAGSGPQAGFYEARVLEPAASFVARKPVRVWCARNDAAWKAYETAAYGAAGGEHGSAPFGGNAIYLDSQGCPPLRTAATGGTVYGPLLAATLQVLTHEAIHARGERDEGVTDCDAMHEMPGVAVRFFHVRAGKELRTLMASAWTYHRAAPPQYLTVC